MGIPTPDQIRATLKADENAEYFGEVDYLDEIGPLVADVVRIADESDLFGDDIEVTFWAVAGADHVVEGGLVTIDLVGAGYTGPRFASRHQEWKDLIDDRDASGFDFCVGIVTGVAHVVDDQIRPHIERNRA